MAGQGGGADRIARLFQSIIQKENLSNMPILPVNKGGGSGAEALRYLKDKEGDAHVIMATLNSYYDTATYRHRRGHRRLHTIGAYGDGHICLVGQRRQ